MKKIILLIVAAIVAGFSVQAKTADEFRIYLNPGHGSYGANDRPMKTIGHPNTGVLNAEGTTWIDTDTLGFYEGRGTLPRAFGIGSYLKSVGVKSENIVYSRLTNGPWPYTPQSQYDPDAIYNKNLADICEEVEEGNFDMFISSHSNAATDGTSSNYPLFLYRGYDTGTTGDAGYNGPGVEGSDVMARTVWPYHYMGEIEPQSSYSMTNMNVRGDISFYGSYSTAVRNNGKAYSGYLGVLKHGVPGYLLEGFFHTYQPSRHRALNFDYDRLEGIREARGVATYFGFNLNGKGEIAGTVKDLHEKIVHNLYNYAYGSDDQWLPINGAQVILKKNGTQVATYDVDQEWNGFYAFFDLEPGDYTIEAVADGYKLLEEPVAATVSADKTCFSFIKLENENYVPDEEVYENYPDPAQPAYLGLAGTYVFGQDGGTTYSSDMVGTVAQALQYGDSTIVLTHEGTAAHIYIVDNNTKQMVKELSTEGVFTMTNNPGFYNQIGSIALSADRKLVGVTAVRTSFADSNVPSGYQRGTMHAYYWNDFDADPTDWFSTQYSSNWFNSDLGFGVAVSGPIKDCVVCVPGPTSGASRGVRPAFFAIQDGSVVSTSRANAQGTITLVGLGDPLATDGNIDNYPVENLGRIKVAVSPFNDKAFIMGGSKTGALYEFPVTADGAAPNCNVFNADAELLGNGMQIFKYAGHTLLVAPYGTTGEVKGIKIYDVTDGLASAKLITTENTDIAAPDNSTRDVTLGSADFAWAGAVVNQEDIHAYLVGSDVNVLKFATDDADQPKVKGIYAYDLHYNIDGNNCTFTFKANQEANDAYITIRDMNSGEEILTLPVNNVVQGENEVAISLDQLPATTGGNEAVLTWEVTLVGDPIARIDVLNDPNQFSFNRIGNTIDNSPESPYFGRFYLVNRIGSSNTANAIYAYTPEWTQIGDPISGEYTLGNPFRLATDQNGTVYLSNWADGARSGVFKLNPETLSGDLEPFFVGTHASNGTITNEAGDMMCTSTPSVFIAGKGADTHMYCHLEDAGNDISQYNIGNADGTIMDSWTMAPTRLWGVGAKLISTHAAVVGESPEGGIWVVQNRSAGQNNSSVPSIIYVNPEGQIVYNSGTEGNPIHEHLTGTQYCGGAISCDGTELVVNQPDGTLKFFKIDYSRNTPTLTWKYDYKHNAGNLVTQINYDYAGNLFVSGSKLAILSMPTDNNAHTTPSTMTYSNPESGGMKGDVNLDGKVDIDDLNIVINVILEVDSAANYDGRVYINDDDNVDIDDVNTLINIILTTE